MAANDHERWLVGWMAAMGMPEGYYWWRGGWDTHCKTYLTIFTFSRTDNNNNRVLSPRTMVRSQPP
jgi:hypothetical protein